MELDNIHQLAQNLQASKSSNQHIEKEIDGIELHLRSVNLKEKKKLRKIAIIFSTIGILFLAILIFPPENEYSLLRQVSRSLFFGIYMVIGFIAWKGKKDLGKTDYSLPVLHLLKKTEERFRFFNPRTWYVIPLLILLDAAGGLTLLSTCYIPCTWDIWLRLGITQLFFLFVLAIGFYFGYQDWKKNRKATWETLKKSIAEMEGM
jgi:hypothetical protein